MKRRRDAAPLVLSIAVHVAVAFAILNAAFHYDFSNVTAVPRDTAHVERLTYVDVAPSGGISGGTDTTSAPARARTPARGLVAPVKTPTALPPVPVAGGQPGGVEAGRGRAGAIGVTTGIVPSIPDPRLSSDPHVGHVDQRTGAL